MQIAIYVDNIPKTEFLLSKMPCSALFCYLYVNWLHSGFWAAEWVYRQQDPSKVFDYNGGM